LLVEVSYVVVRSICMAVLELPKSEIMPRIHKTGSRILVISA
jgi:hypothetical protein